LKRSDGGWSVIRLHTHSILKMYGVNSSQGKLKSGSTLRERALDDDEGDIVLLLARAELADFADDGGEKVIGGKGTVSAQGSHEAVFAEFIARVVEGFGDAVGVKGKRIARKELRFADGAIPFLEHPEDCGRRVEPLERIVLAEQKSGKMAAVGVAQTARGIVIFGEKKSSEGTVGGVLAKELIHGTQKTLRLIDRDGALATQIGLQIGHQEGGGDPFPGNVPNDKAEAFAS
jgi:hypothetical protein